MKILFQTRQKTAISLFSGAGGMDLGINEAGFEVLASIENDPNCCQTLRTNITRLGWKTRLLESDIRQIEPLELMKELQLESGQLDLLFGGSPCQSFSQIGKQNALQDERGLLLFEMIRFAKILRPQVILIEQVKGLLTAKDNQGVKGGVFNLLIDQLKQLGYQVTWNILCAADFGVPQLRKRLFILATNHKKLFQFPLPTHSAVSEQASLSPLSSYRTVQDVLTDLREPSPKTAKISPPIDSHLDITPDGDRRRIQGVPEGSYLAAQTHLPASQRQKLTKKDTTKFLRVHRQKPVNTLRGGEIFFHPTEDRYLTPREYMRLHGFPDWYLLTGPIRGRSGRVRTLDQHRQVANAVPPPVAKALGVAISSMLDQEDTGNNQQIFSQIELNA